MLRQLEDWIYDLKARGTLGEGIVLVMAQPPRNPAARNGIVVWKDNGSDPLLAHEVESAFQ